MASDRVGFVTKSVRGRQKSKLNLRRYLRLLPAHKRLTKFDKLWKRKGFQRRDVET